MLWVKAFHVIFMVTWFAGLFYLPRLFVYHAMAMDQGSIERFKRMERKLFFGIMTPGAVLTIISGLWLWLGDSFEEGWLRQKVAGGRPDRLPRFWRQAVLGSQARPQPAGMFFFFGLNRLPFCYSGG